MYHTTPPPKYIEPKSSMLHISCVPSVHTIHMSPTRLARDPNTTTHIHAECTFHIPRNKASPCINVKPQLSISQDNASQCLGHEVGAVFIRECGLRCDSCMLHLTVRSGGVGRGPSDTQCRGPVYRIRKIRCIHTYICRYVCVSGWICLCALHTLHVPDNVETFPFPFQCSDLAAF